MYLTVSNMNPVCLIRQYLDKYELRHFIFCVPKVYFYDTPLFLVRHTTPLFSW